MRRFLRCNTDDGLVETQEWEPHCWVNIECPDAVDFDMMLNDFKIPQDFIDSIGDPDERPRIEHDNGWIFTVLRIPVKLPTDDECPYITVPFGIALNNDVVLTLTDHKSDFVQDFIEHVRQRGIVLDTEPDFILRFIYSSTYWYLKYLKEINDHVNKVSTRMKRSISNNELLRLMSTNEVLVYFNTSIKGNETLIERIKRIYEGQYDVDLLEDTEIEIKQADNTVDVYIEILSGMMDSFGSIISNNVNDIMKKMTGVSIVLMLPTLIASFYGMNVSNDFEGYRWAFWAIVCGSFILALLLYAVLRRIRWL